MSKYDRTFVIYFGILIVCFLLADVAEKKNNKHYVFLIAFILSFFMGFRNKSVGVDANNYYYLIASVKDFSKIWTLNDPVFYIFAHIVLLIKNDPYFFIEIVAFISNFLIIYRLWDFREFASFKYSVFRYITLFYFYAFNCIRQFFAMSILFYGTKFLYEKNYRKFINYIVIASLFHLSALTGLLYIGLEKFKWEELETKNKNLVNSFLFLSPFVIALVYFLTKDRLEVYEGHGSMLSNWLQIVLKILLFIALYLIELKRRTTPPYDLIKLDTETKMVDIYYLIGLLPNALGLFIGQFERLGYYYYLFAMVFVGRAANAKRYRLIIRALILFIFIRSFYLGIVNSSQAQTPYLFNWE